jgi:hypothetical protein
MPTMMIIGWSLFFIALGAVLKWAITAHVHGINLHTMGVILMVVGAVGLCIGLFQVFRGRSSTDLDRTVS